MSKTVKKIASVALPIVGNMVAPGIGGVIGGALGGALGGGGIRGALMGGITGYLGSQSGPIAGLNNAASTVGSFNPNAINPASVVGSTAKAVSPVMNSGIGGFINNTVKSLAAPLQNISQTQLLNAASGIVGSMNQDAAEEAAKKNAQGIQTGIQANTKALQPYTQLGQQATTRINEIQSDPAGYIKNNPLYNSLAADAERRLLANQAAKGKVGSGGTAAALQEQLLNLGTGLVNTEIGNLQNQAGIGVGAAGQVGSTAYSGNTNIGNAQAAGVIGANNALTSQYQNQINTILAAQGVNKAPIYSQPINL